MFALLGSLAASAAAAEGTNFVLQADPLGLFGGNRISGLSLRTGSSDFFERNAGGMIGFKAGFEFPAVELFFDYHQTYDENNWKEAWYAGMLGLHDEFRLEGRSFMFVAADVGYGAGTEGTLSQSNQVGNMSQHGIVAVLRLGPEYYVSRWVALGLEFDVGYHYLWLGGPPVDVAGRQDHVQGIHYNGMLFARFLFGSGNEQLRARPTTVQPVYQGPVYQQYQPQPQPVYPQPVYPPYYQRPAPQPYYHPAPTPPPPEEGD
ncbi:MAG TPA: hypothetical protein VGQ83_25880 [Polyangia bacterium]